MKKPNFICIGAQKAGTTWLYNNLLQHPQVALLPLKELHYFDEIETGLKTDLVSRFTDKHWMNEWWRNKFKHYLYKAWKEKNVADLKWILKYFLHKRNFEWYSSLFPDVQDKITGDLTPAYTILSEPLVAKINQHLPDAKIILLLRNPAERDWSQYKMVLKRTGRTDLLNDTENEHFRKIIKEKGDRSNYAAAIKNWSKHYSEKQFFIGFYDAILTHPQQLFDEICAFLGIDSFDTGSTSAYFNKGIEKSAHPAVEKLLAEKYKEDLKELAGIFSNSSINYPEIWYKKYFEN
jgi:hypothetical protein